MLVVCRIQRWWRQNPNHPEATCVRLSNDWDHRWWDYWPAAGGMCWKWTWLHWALQPALLSARPGPFWLRKSMEFDSRCYCSDAPRVIIAASCVMTKAINWQIDTRPSIDKCVSTNLDYLGLYLTISASLNIEVLVLQLLQLNGSWPCTWWPFPAAHWSWATWRGLPSSWDSENCRSHPWLHDM